MVSLRKFWLSHDLRMPALVFVLSFFALPVLLASPNLSLRAAELAPIPALTGRVVDATGTLTETQVAALSTQLQNLETEKGSQVAVLMVPTTAPEDIAAFSIRVAEAWKLGRKKVDDGALLIIAKNDRTLRIEVGYGLEGALSDLVSRRIIDDHITPKFRQGDFAGGVQAGVEAMAAIIRGEDLPPPAAQGTGRGDGGVSDGKSWLEGLGAVIMAGFFLAGALGPLKSGLLAGVVAFAIAFFSSTGWVLSAFLGVVAFFIVLIIGSVIFLGRKMTGGRSFGGSGRNRSGMGWGGGGFGGRSGGFGGGFGGGGGSFGGGGASGRW
jgi:uncharacterized protein